MARKAKKKSKGMGIKTSVKSGNFLPTSTGAGMTAGIIGKIDWDKAKEQGTIFTNLHRECLRK